MVLQQLDPLTYKSITYKSTDIFVIAYRKKTGQKRVQSIYKAKDINTALENFHKFPVDSDHMKYLFRSPSSDRPFDEVIYKMRGLADPQDVPAELKPITSQPKGLSKGITRCDIRVVSLPKKTLEEMDRQDWRSLHLPEFGSRVKLIQFLLSYFFSLNQDSKVAFVNKCRKAHADAALADKEVELL